MGNPPASLVVGRVRYISTAHAAWRSARHRIQGNSSLLAPGPPLSPGLKARQAQERLPDALRGRATGMFVVVSEQLSRREDVPHFPGHSDVERLSAHVLSVDGRLLR